MKKLFKRWLSWVLVLALSLSLMPTTLLPGASAIANMAISNFTLDAETGDWSFDLAGQGPTNTMSIALILDARSDAALASSLPSYRATHDDISGATNGLAQKSIATEPVCLLVPTKLFHNLTRMAAPRFPAQVI